MATWCGWSSVLWLASGALATAGCDEGTGVSVNDAWIGTDDSRVAPPYDSTRPLADAQTDGPPTHADAVVVNDAGGLESDLGYDAVGPTDTGGDTAADVPVEIDTGLGGWQIRECNVVLRYVAPPDARNVLLAGDFTQWADNPLSMSDADGDGTFEITLQPGPGLISGQLHAYKFVVDDRWILDPAATHAKYDGDCVNSAFLMPACDEGPELTVESLEPSVDGDRGGLVARIRPRLATDGSPPHRTAFALDGEALPEGAVQFDEAAGIIEIRVDDLPLGRHVLGLRLWDDADRAAQPLDLPFWLEAQPFSWRDAVLYMIVIDRFANGQLDNDAPVGPPVQYPADWHGGDLWGALQVMQSGYFESLGVNAIWLSPINTQVDGHFPGRDDPMDYAAYHGYWPIRGREVDPRYGGDEALDAFVQEAHRRGIRVMLDLINNQIHEEHEYYTDHPEWFRAGCVCGIDENCGWSDRPLDCLFAPYLPDINWRIPEAAAQFIDDAVYWIERFGVDGFRVDAVKHVETVSIYNMRAELTRRFEQGGERIVMLGETAVGEGDHYDDHCGIMYNSGYEWIEAYTGPTALDGQFDFPSHHRMQWGLLTGELGYDSLESIINDMEVRYSPSALHVRFLGSHDSSRMASRAARDPARDCRWPGDAPCDPMPQALADAALYERLRRAFTLLLTLPGIPLIYYGDEVAMAGGGDPDSRRDMAWEGDLADVAMRPDPLDDAQRALREWIRDIAAVRADSPALAHGRRVPLLWEPDLYVYALVDGPPNQDANDAAVVVLNRGGGHVNTPVEGPAMMNLRGIGRFDVVVGAGELTRADNALSVSIPAGGAAIFRGRAGGP